MGKGNQIIRGRDAEGVRTFFFDPYGSFDDEKKAYIEQKREDLAEELQGLPFDQRRRKVEQMMMDCRLPVRVKDDVIWDRINDNCEDEIDNISYEVGSLEGFKRIPKKERESEEVLVAGSREYGQVIAGSDNCQVVIGDNESTVAIGCIPTETKDNIADVVRQDTELEGEEYDAEVERRWEEHLAKYKKDANAAMRKIHEFFGTQSISERDGAWTSSRLKPYEELTEEERNNYY